MKVKVVKEVKKEKVKRSFKEEKEFKEIVLRMAGIEKRKKEITALFEAATTDASQLLELSAEMEKITEELDDKEMRWLELDELDAN